MTVAVFGYLILINTFLPFYFSVFSLVLIKLKRYIKHLRQYLTAYLNTLKFVKNTPLRVAFSTLFSVSGNVVRHSLTCLINYYSCNACTSSASLRNWNNFLDSPKSPTFAVANFFSRSQFSKTSSHLFLIKSESMCSCCIS